MASLARPTKRQKQVHENVEEITRKPIVPNGIGCLETTTFYQMVEKLSETDVNCSDDLIEILGQLRSRICLLEYNGVDKNAALSIYRHYNDRSTMAKLHRTLILYTGFILGSRRETLETNKNWEEVLSALISCLRDLHTNNKVMIHEFIGEEEFNELFVLVPKVVHDLSTTSGNEKAFETALMQKTNIHCYEMMKCWINTPVLVEEVVKNSTTSTLENFLFALLKSTDTTIEQDRAADALESLRLLCNDESEFRKLLDAAQSAFKLHTSPILDHLSPRLTIFYWRCISCIEFRMNVMQENNRDSRVANCAIDSVLTYAASKDPVLSRQAMSCIGEFIESSSHDRHTRLILCTKKILLEMSQRWDDGISKSEKENDKDMNVIQMLQCLGTCMKRASAVDFFLRMNGWQNVFDILVSISVDERDANVAEKATIIILPILKALITSAEHHSSILVDKALSALISLVSLHNERIVGSSVRLLFILSQKGETRKRMDSSSLLPDLVTALGDLSCKNFFVEENKKERLAQTFSLLIDEVRNVNFLARKSSNLSFLVRLANDSYCETDQNRVQNISICTIMKLAKNPCNQRILAKEPGLLSTLIRYTRMTPEDTEVMNERGISRKELKDRILLMANAL